MRNRLLLHTFALLALLAPSSWAQLSISEVIAIAVADERGVEPDQYQDEDGHLSDIIEVHNAGDETISLKGYALTDDKDELQKWSFSSNQRIEPGEYLTVYASGKSKTGLFASIPHTNFSLSRSGEYLALVSPEGEILQEFDPLPKMYDRVSYGPEGYMTQPTPGAPNTEAVDPPSTGVEFSIRSQTFFEPLTLELYADDLPEGAYIGYTDDGSIPKVSLFTPPKRYTEPIEITETTQIRARVFEPGKLDSEVETETFVQVGESFRDWSTNLPVIVLDNDNGGRPSTSRFEPSSWMILEPKAQDGSDEKRTRLDQIADLHTRAGIRVRGSSTSGNQKMSLAVEAWYDDANWADKDIEPLGLPADSDWVLSGRMQFDRALMRNPLAYEIFRQMGWWAPRTRFVEVFMNLDGGELDENDYYGVYTFMEKIKISDDRVQIEEASGGKDGGFIVKVDRVSKAGGDKSFSAAGQTVVWVEPQGDYVTNQQNTALKGYMDQAVEAMRSDDPENPETGYRNYIDTKSWIDEYLLRTLTRDPDGLRLSTYIHKPINGKLFYGPVWDFDRTMGCDSDDRARVVNQWVSYFATHGWYRYMLGSGVNRKGGTAVLPEFWQEWIDRYHELRRTVWRDENIHAIIDDFAAQIREAQERNFARWTGTRPDSGNVKDYNDGVTGWEGEVVHLKGWFTARMEWMDEQFTIQAGMDHAGVLASGDQITVRSGGTLFSPQEVYYTLDGSDPRLPGGEVNPQAIKAGKTIEVTEDMEITYRAKREEHWAGVARTAVVMDGVPASAENLLVSEIQYHPNDGNTDEQGEGYFHEDLFEFIELMNVSDRSMYLGDVRLTEGIAFDFSESEVQLLKPGQRVVIVSDEEAFAARYGDVRIAGEYVGQLANGGETIAIHRGEEMVHRFAYNDRAPWPTTPDTFGFSLTLADPAPGVDLSDPAQWTVDTSAKGGSPGAVGDTPPAVVVNEVLANPSPNESDAIEIYNASDAAVDISGWWLTDQASEPMKFAIPSGTMLPAGAYLVFRADNDNDPANNTDLPDGFFGNAFGLRSEGESVWLFSATPEGELTGYRDGFSFGDTDPGTTVGRYVTRDGDAQDVLQQEPTLGGPNAGPAISPVVITEVMYHPLESDGVEYVEIKNHTDAAALLHDPAYPDHVWRVSGIDFEFPSGSQLGAGELALIVSTDPDTFRAAHGLPSSVQVFGPFSGRLDNAGESLRLQRPGEAVEDGNGGLDYRYVTVDRIDYDNGSPWPSEADGGGASLERRGLTTYGNQASNWIATDGGSPGAYTESENSGSGGGDPDGNIEITGIATTAAGVAIALPEGTTYDLEFSTDLVNWTVIATDITDAYEDVDDARVQGTTGYYRGIVK